MNYVVINTQNKECLVYKDKKMLAERLDVAYIAIERALKKSKVYIKDDFMVFPL